MSIRSIAALACCTLAMSFFAVGCAKNNTNGEMGAVSGEKACCGSCGNTCTKDAAKKDAAMGAVGAKKEGCCSAKSSCSKDAAMGAMGAEKKEGCATKSSCSKDAAMGAMGEAKTGCGAAKASCGGNQN